MSRDRQAEQTLRGRTWTSSTCVAGRLGQLFKVPVVLLVGAAVSLAGTPAYAAGVPEAPPSARSETGASGAYVVRAHPADLDAVKALVEATGGAVTSRLDIIDALVTRLTPQAAQRLSQDPRVRAVTPDAAVHLLGTTTPTTTTTTVVGTGYNPSADSNSMLNITNAIGARTVWKPTKTNPGYTGKGIGVALIDSGVSPVPGLDGTGKLVHGPDLSFESQVPALQHLDTYGHGTHMAGIIAGHDAGVDAKGTPAASSFLGVAPDARIISVKVADSAGATDVSQVIAGIDWVVQHKDDPGMNIRVLNLSFGTPSTQPYTLDPLAYAAEVAWRKGIVVVVSAGNDGTGTGKLLNPAQDPFVLAVGAEDTAGTTVTGDDVIPSFSTRGDGVRNPDLVTPGSHVQSLRVPGSYIDTQWPVAGFGDRYFRGSGTSQAAAVASGAAALMLEARPALTPDQVKGLLKNTALSLPKADQQAQGRGLVQVGRAIAASASAYDQKLTPSTGTGSLDAARGGARLVQYGVELSGEKDVLGGAYDTTRRAAEQAAGTSWTGGIWNGNGWTGDSVASDGAWTGRTWAGNDWAGRTWAGRTWAAGTWTGRTWAGQSWSTGSWVDGTLAGRTWAGRTWASGGWQ